ncbi:hypothetical protein EW026_g160 [Hermanssonia centrifuga]|uniref:Elongation factor 2 n=1 Tax=Hermanssonia centrifuga TaxID=98765 RepID=A0A4V6S131_9APHY|nr:hypothetical protein EW026_g160 [Hermanssonia centrifuga]
MNATRNHKERVSKLLLLYANQTEEVETLSFGSVGVILGLLHTRTGDTLMSTKRSEDDDYLRDIVPPPPVMSASVLPQSHSDLGPVQEALNSLSRTDPSVRIELQEGQILVHGLGALHLEIVESRLRDEWNVNFEFGKRMVSYREGLGPGNIDPKPGSWKTEMFGKPFTIDVDLDVRAFKEGEKGDPLWDGNVVLGPSGRPLPLADTFADQDDPLASISRGISNALSSSPHSTFPLSNVHIQVKKWQYPSQAMPASTLAGASAYILREIFRVAGMGPLMEPYIRMKVTVNEESLGKTMKDLTEHGAEVSDLAASSVGGADMDEDVAPYSEDGVYFPPELLSPASSSSAARNSTASLRRSIHAVAPLSQMLNFSSRLRALSGGHGVFEMANAGFRKVTEGRKLDILKEMGRA